MDANNTKALFRRGKAYMNTGELEKAKEDLEKASTIQPSEEINRELAKVKQKLNAAKQKEKKFYGNMFNKLTEESKNEGGLYEDMKPEEEPKTKLCTFCNQQIETVQWARHVIKYHSNQKKKD